MSSCRVVSCFVLIVGLLGLLLSTDLAAAADKLNVLLIAVDDMNNDLGCYGHPQVKSPAIDALAARGVRFDRAYCQYPVCNPSRVSMLSGRRPDTTRIYDLQTPPRTHLKDVVFLPQYFRQHGYYTAHIGKIFHTGDAFEDPPSWDHEVRETGKHPPAEAVIREQRLERPQKYSVEWNILRSTDEQTADGVVAQQADELLERVSQDGKPFFVAVGFRRPHAPYAAPKKYFDLYPVDSIPPLDESPEHLQHIPTSAFTYPAGTSPITARERAAGVAAYWACITFVDAQIGKVLATVDRLNLWKNTVVVFYSDHGYHLGEHGGMWHKMSVFEESARVPLIIAAPGITGKGKPSPRLVELVDIYPTLVDLCGLPTPAGLEGQSLRPLLDNPDSPWTDAAYTQVLRGEVVGRSLRTSRWRYTEWDGGANGRELYDHDADPKEQRNLADDPQHEATRKELGMKLRERLRESAGKRGDSN